VIDKSPQYEAPTTTIYVYLLLESYIELISPFLYTLYPAIAQQQQQQSAV
jgi:hypothetical protein